MENNENKTEETIYTNKRVFNFQNKKKMKQAKEKPQKQVVRKSKKEVGVEAIQTNTKGPKVKITFLGGVGEIGKNMTVFETEKDIVIIDCGMTFPDSELPGIDVVVPDISYLVANKQKIRGVFLHLSIILFYLITIWIYYNFFRFIAT